MWAPVYLRTCIPSFDHSSTQCPPTSTFNSKVASNLKLSSFKVARHRADSFNSSSPPIDVREGPGCPLQDNILLYSMVVDFTIRDLARRKPSLWSRMRTRAATVPVDPLFPKSPRYKPI